MSRVLVLGASGYIGSQLVPRLVAAGHRVRAASRRLEFLEGRGWCGVELVQADALDPETLPPVLEDIDVVYYMVHSRGAGRGFAAREREAAENLSAAAADAGVARIICLSSQGNGSAGGQRNGADIGAILRSGPVPVSDVRSSVIIGPGSACFEITRDLVRKLPQMVTPRWTRQPVRPVALDELLAYLVELVDQPDNGTNVHCLAGPEEVTFEALMRDFAGIEGRRPRIIPVPVATPGLSALWLDLTTSLPLHMGRPLIESFRNPPGNHVADGSRVTVTCEPPGEAMRRAFETERDAGLAARWAEGAVTYRGYNPDPGYYRLSFSSEVAVAAPGEFTWKAVSRIGGNVGYYYGDYLWKIRGVIDRLVGGVGMRRGRRHPEQLRAGDALDFWRVAVAEPPRQLTLVAEMKVPGHALLEFAVLDDGAERSRVKVDARFHPSGLAGLVYWYSLLPVHSFIFKHMPRNLGIAAEQAWQESQPPPADGVPFGDGALSRFR